jgi:D-glucuronyl C5-epimerase C-terminus
MGVRAALILALALAAPASAAQPEGSIESVGPAVRTQAPPPVRVELPDGRTLRSALRRARMAGHIGAAEHARMLTVVDRARRAVRKLRGLRRTELVSVLGAAEALAADGRLAASRLRQVVLTLHRNIDVFANGSLPAVSQRMSFGADPLVFQYFPGRGMQLHPLATFGAANALAVPCLRERERRDRARLRVAASRGLARRLGVERGQWKLRRPRFRPAACRQHALRRTLDRLAAVAVRRGGFAAWEYAFSFGPGGPFWISAMTQGTAVQALARGGLALGEPRYLELAEQALGAFDAAPPTGVGMPGARYAMYSQQPTLEVFNGFLQAVIGLHDHAQLTGSTRSRRLYRRAEGVARGWIGAVDTGAWSLYSRGGREATLHYHRLARLFLDRLCERTRRAAYCRAEARFRRYESEPPRLRLGVPSRPRAQEPATLAITLSKVSTVVVRAGRWRRVLQLPRGTHRVTWTPAERGAQRITATATGPGGTRGATAARTRVLMSHAQIAERRRKARERQRRAQERRRAEQRRRSRERRRDEAGVIAPAPVPAGD